MAKRIPGKPPKIHKNATPETRAFAQRLFAARRRKFEHANAFARSVGIPEKNYTRYESAETPVPFQHLERIAKGVDESLDWLVCADKAARRHPPKEEKAVQIVAAE